MRGTFGIVLLILAYGLAFGRVLWGWALDAWVDPNYGHVIPLAVVLLVVGAVRSARASRLESSGEGGGAGGRFGAVCAAVGFLLAAAGMLAAESTAQRIGAVLMALALVEWVLPQPQRQAWRGPLLAMLLLVPWPYVAYYALTARLQLWSSAAAESALRASGIPLVREGNLLRFPGYQLEVVEACSGLRSILTLTALAPLVAVLFRCSPRRSLVLLAVAVPLAWFTNLIRLVATGYAAQLSGPEAAERAFHLAGGLVGFALGALVLTAIALVGRRPGRGS